MSKGFSQQTESCEAHTWLTSCFCQAIENEGTVRFYSVHEKRVRVKNIRRKIFPKVPAPVSEIMVSDEKEVSKLDGSQSTIDQAKKRNKTMDEEQNLNQRLLRSHSDDISYDEHEGINLLESSTGNEEDNTNNEGANQSHPIESNWSRCKRNLEYCFYTTLFPDEVPSIGSMMIFESVFTVKLLKFIIWTFILIAIIHKVVPHLTDDRDQDLELWQIVVFDGNLIVCDLTVFFLVGRMWRQKLGIDHLGFLIWAVLANIYFQLQPYFNFLQHSVTLYEMHCGKSKKTCVYSYWIVFVYK